MKSGWADDRGGQGDPTFPANNCAALYCEAAPPPGDCTGPENGRRSVSVGETADKTHLPHYLSPTPGVGSAA